MTAIVVTVTSTTTPDTLATEAAEGKVKFHTERANGTTRRVQFLAEGTRDREVAEWVVEQRAEGRTMKQIAAEMHVSVPTVRRMINALLLTWEAEEDAADLLDSVEIIETPAHVEIIAEAVAAGTSPFEALVAAGAAEGQQG